MAITLISGQAKLEVFPKKASTALSANAALKFDGSGYVTVALATDTKLAGVGLRAVTSASDDYALTTPVPVVIPTAESRFLADVGAGTATAALVGTTCDLYTGGASVDVGTDTHHQVTITRFISATQVEIVFNSAYEFKNAS